MRSRPRRWPRVLAGTVSAFVLVLTGMSGVGAVVYRNLDNNITSKDMTNVIATADPSGSASASASEPPSWTAPTSCFAARTSGASPRATGR